VPREIGAHLRVYHATINKRRGPQAAETGGFLEDGYGEGGGGLAKSFGGDETGRAGAWMGQLEAIEERGGERRRNRIGGRGERIDVGSSGEEKRHRRDVPIIQTDFVIPERRRCIHRAQRSRCCKPPIRYDEQRLEGQKVCHGTSILTTHDSPRRSGNKERPMRFLVFPGTCDQVPGDVQYEPAGGPKETEYNGRATGPGFQQIQDFVTTLPCSRSMGSDPARSAFFR
jgi:hypothetical protein